eukprot:Lankesteria_metandrocarpae@DN5491_c1_g1_i10.p1
MEPAAFDADSVLKHNTAKRVPLLGLNPCRPSNERELEDWADLTARKCEATRPSLDKLIEVVKIESSEAVKTVLTRTTVKTFEEMIAKVATALFDPDREMMRLEDKLFKPNQLFRRLKDTEMSLRDENEQLPEPRSLVMAVGEKEQPETDDVVMQQGSQQQSGGYRIAKYCKGCGKTGHPYHKCYFKDYRCNNCHQKGHVSKACPTYVNKDERGRVVVRTTPKPSGVEHFVKQDRSAVDRIDTVEATMQKFKEKLMQTKEKAQKRRELREKPEARGQGRKREYPTGIVLDDSKSTDREDDIDDLLHLMDDMQVIMA